MKKIIFVLAAIAVSAANVTPASAGGLFGEGGLIRGDVGKFMHDKVQAPVLTPIIQNTVVGATTAVGGAVGGFIGGPTGAAVGGYAGEYMGQEINRRAAGQSNPIGRPAQYSQPQASDVGYPAQGGGYYPPPPPVVVIGNACSTDVGSYFGPPNPVGNFCTASTPFGYRNGYVVRM